MREGVSLMEIKAKEVASSTEERIADILEGLDMDDYPEVESEASIPTPSESKKKATTMKVIVWVCLVNGLAWVWCSYILAWMGREQIAESLSQVALTEIIGVVLVYAIKAAIENLSKNNSWPDKHRTDSPDGVG